MKLCEIFGLLQSIKTTGALLGQILAMTRLHHVPNHYANCFCHKDTFLLEGIVSRALLKLCSQSQKTVMISLPGSPSQGKTAEGGCFTLLGRPPFSSNTGKKKDLCCRKEWNSSMPWTRGDNLQYFMKTLHNHHVKRRVADSEQTRVHAEKGTTRKVSNWQICTPY